MSKPAPQLSLSPSNGLSTDHVIYLELDAVLDTRLGTLDIMNPEFSKATVSNPGYFRRVSDDFSVFCDVKFEDYKEAYRKRSIETLQHSVVTNASFVLNSVVNELNRQRKESPFAASVTVEVNIAPYNPDGELRMELENAIATMLPVDVAVRSVNIPIEQLTLQHVAKNYTGMLIYNFAEWLQLHSREFENVQIPGITILAPQLHVEGHKAFESSDLGEGGAGLDPYEVIAILHAPLMGLEWLEPHHFCMVTHESVEAYRQSEEAQQPQESA